MSLLATVALAHSGDRPYDADNTTVAQLLSRYLTTPEQVAIRQPSVVVIQFRVNDASEICQLTIFSDDKNLKESLIRQLTGRKLKGYMADTQDIQTVRIHFRP